MMQGELHATRCPYNGSGHSGFLGDRFRGHCAAGKLHSESYSCESRQQSRSGVGQALAHQSGTLAVTQKRSDSPPDQRKPVPAAYGQELITQRGVFGAVAGHQNRHLVLDPKTGAMFVGVGSAGNIGVEPEVKASIQRFEADGSGQTTFASGMRNPTTLAFHPTTGEL